MDSCQRSLCCTCSAGAGVRTQDCVLSWSCDGRGRGCGWGWSWEDSWDTRRVSQHKACCCETLSSCLRCCCTELDCGHCVMRDCWGCCWSEHSHSPLETDQIFSKGEILSRPRHLPGEAGSATVVCCTELLAWPAVFRAVQPLQHHLPAMSKY